MRLIVSARLFVRMHEHDDVATALIHLEKGFTVNDPAGSFSVVLQESIAFGHKFALRTIYKDGLVHKYGQIIGVATQDILPGQHVHVHNVASRRGRGDLGKGVTL